MNREGTKIRAQQDVFMHLQRESSSGTTVTGSERDAVESVKADPFFDEVGGRVQY